MTYEDRLHLLIVRLAMRGEYDGGDKSYLIDGIYVGTGQKVIYGAVERLEEYERWADYMDLKEAEDDITI